MFDLLSKVQVNAGLPIPSGFDSIADILGLAINVVMGIGFGIAILSIAYSGLLYIFSVGDPKAAAKAWNAFLWGTIAAFISIGAFALKKAVLSAVGVDQVNITNDLPNI